MPIHIQLLISNVMVEHEAAVRQPAMFDTPSAQPAGESLQPLPELQEDFELEEPPAASLTPAEQEAITRDLEQAIVQAVADRVARLMRDDISIARERE